MDQLMLFAKFNFVRFTIILRLKKLNKEWKITRWIPGKFSEKNKAEGAPICNELLQRNQQSLFLNNLVRLFNKHQKKKGLCCKHRKNVE